MNNDYDTYDGCIVAAESEDEARLIHPGGGKLPTEYDWTWVSDPGYVRVELIGTAATGIASGVILASFNAG